MMMFQEPIICFVSLDPLDAIYTSGASYACCEKMNGTGMNKSAFCAMGGEEYSSMPDTQICVWVANYYSGDPDATSVSTSYVPKDPTVAPEPTEAVKNAIVPEAPNATPAPVRSAPHFNNNLFN